MKILQFRDRTKPSKTPNRASSSITVERSYEVSFDYSMPSTETSTSHGGMAWEGEKTEAHVPHNLTHKPDKSSNRSLRIPARLTTSGFNDSACSIPVIRRSQDRMDLHEALRSQLPAFRQSRRWARTYLSKEDQENSIPRNGNSPRKRRSMLSCDVSTSTRGVSTTNLHNEDDQNSEHDGSRKPMYLPGWQVIKRKRLCKRHSNPLTVIGTGVSKSPKRTKSASSLRGGAKTDVLSTTMSREIQHSLKHGDEIHKPASRESRRSRKLSLENSSQQACVARNVNTSRNTACATDTAVPPLHDYQKVRWFSQECKNMLSGLDFGDEWRLSMISNQLTTMPDSTEGVPTSQGRQQLGHNRQDSQIIPSALVHSESCIQPWLPDQSSCSRDNILGTARPEYVTDAVKGNSLPDRDGDNETGCHPLCSVSATNHHSSTSSLNQSIDQTFTKSLKTVRSVDTLTLIEAQVDDSVQGGAEHDLKKKSSSFTVSSSPRNKKPSGGPPERPLPNIPKDDISDSKSTVYRCPSFASSCRSRVKHDAMGEADPFIISTLHNVVTIPHDGACEQNYFQRNLIPTSGSVRNMSHSALDIEEPTHDLVAVAKQVIMYPATMGSASPGLKVKEFINDRNNKTQQIKKKHVAAWNKSQESLLILDDGDRVNSSTPSLSGSDGELPRLVGIDLQTGNMRPLRTDPVDNKDDSAWNGVHTSVTPIAPLGVTTSRAPEQLLGLSRIMIVVDTNPYTSSFRAGTLSPSPSMVFSSNIPTTLTNNKAGKNSCQPLPIKNTDFFASAVSKHDGLLATTNNFRQTTSVQKKRSSNNLRSQASTARDSISNLSKATSERVATGRSQSRTAPRSNHYNIASSDSEPELLSHKSTIAPPTAPAPKVSRSNTRRLQQDRDSPLTTILKRDLCRPDQDAKDIRQHEESIEQLQVHLEQTLKIWSRMSKHGKRQFIVSTFGTGVKQDQSEYEAQTKKPGTTTTSASSIYSKRSSVQRMNDVATQSLNEVLNLAQGIAHKDKDIAGPDTPAVNAADSDTDASTETADSCFDKRASGGSLTDTQDYEIPAQLSAHTVTGKPDASDVHVQNIEADTLGADLDQLRARLQATRRPLIPVRCIRVSSSSSAQPPQHTLSSPAIVISDTRDPLKPISDRLAVAPWEEQEEEVKDRKTAEDDEASGVERESELSFDDCAEPLRTDQMDAMLSL